MTSPFPHRPRWSLALGGLALLGGAVALGGALRDPVGEVPAGGFEMLRAEAEHRGSESCLPCHRERHRSWHRTFHRTMTQEASAEAVVAPFDGRARTWLGVPSTPRRSADGGYEIETTHPRSGERRAFPVVRTVGSRRMQQYVTRLGDRHVRLPVAYSLAEERWFHLSEAFFHPDGEPFHANTAVWDLNCIFCHNVGPRPGFDPSPPRPAELGPPGTIDSEVAELGIACEACHGPGEEHARRMRSPLRRLAFRFYDGGDPTIVQPGRLEPMRSIQVCGHCHGQRVPREDESIRQILGEGDPFTPGEDLGRYYVPITAETRLGEHSFAPRFWGDGSPRLTAYEYQGLLRSACFTRGGMTCLSCHAMHAGDPRGQLRPDREGDALCTQCHGEYIGEGLARHTRHEPAGEGSRCIGCHMPEVVYGIMSWHPTHEIASPDPRRAAAHSMPDACTLCHAGRSRRWAAEATERWWPREAGSGESELSDAPELPRALVAGDVVYRTLAAHRLGQPAPEPGPEKLVQPLLARLLEDAYPNVRRTASRTLARLTGMRDLPAAHAPEAERRRAREELTIRPEPPYRYEGAAWPYLEDGRLDPALLAGWRAQRVEVPVAIGE